jgi:hypothetical protein
MEEDEVARYAEEYLKTDKAITGLNKQKETIKGVLKGHVEAVGDVDDKGHKWYQAGRFFMQVQRRQGSESLNKERAEAWAKDKGIWEEVSKTVTEVYLDEDDLLGYMFDNREDKDLEREFKELYDVPSPTWAFMKPVEEEHYDY